MGGQERVKPPAPFSVLYSVPVGCWSLSKVIPQSRYEGRRQSRGNLHRYLMYGLPIYIHVWCACITLIWSSSLWEERKAKTKKKKKKVWCKGVGYHEPQTSRLWFQRYLFGPLKKMLNLHSCCSVSPPQHGRTGTGQSIQEPLFNERPSVRLTWIEWWLLLQIFLAAKRLRHDWLTWMPLLEASWRVLQDIDHRSISTN